jgi:aldose 1-epimerase
MTTPMLLVRATACAAICAAAICPAADQPTPSGEAAMPMPTVAPFGTLPDGREASLYTLEVPGGWKTTITDYGAIVTSFLVPPRDPAGEPVDVVLGFDTLDGYVQGHPYFGAICGRYSNRIAAGRFELDGRAFTLATNNGANHLHGGVKGFDKQLWKGTPKATDRGPAVEFELVSPDGDEGYPGRLAAKAVYTLTPAGELIVEMTATTDAATVVNLVNHAYWNMAGHGSGSIATQELAVDADGFIIAAGWVVPQSRASWRICSTGTPHTSAARSGDHCKARAFKSSQPRV